MHRNKRPAEPKGRGAAKARQLGLLVDFSPDDSMMMDMNSDESNSDLEAELAEITGEKPASRGKPKGKVPLPMEDIERMAALCMKDLDEEADDDDGDDDVDDDADLMAELNEVLEDDRQNKNVPSPVESKLTSDSLPQSIPTPAVTGGLEGTLVERIDMYRSAIDNAKQSGESSKIRRYERGLKTLQSMLTSVKKGKQINEEDIPPPVASGKSSNAAKTQLAPGSSAPLTEDRSVLIDLTVPGVHPVPEARPAPPPLLPKPKLSVSEVTPPPSVKRPSMHAEVPVPAKMEAATPVSNNRAVPGNSSMKETAMSRQREYKLAALQAKRNGDTELATRLYRISKKFDPVLEALDRGETVELSGLPPPFDRLPKDQLSIPPPPSSSAPSVPTTASSQPLTASSAIPPPPKDLMEALQQRMDKYKSAAAQAKNAQNDRKARMHERIVKQYQDAIRAYKGGKNVNLSELPVPPGFPPLQGAESGVQDQSIVGVLESAMKLANQQVNDDDNEDDEPLQQAPAQRAAPQARPRTSASGAPPAVPTNTGNPAKKQMSNKAQQQLEFLQNRKKQFMQAALRTKQKNDIEGAKLYLRQAKGLDPMIEAAKGGLPVDITKVPAPPENEEDFVLVQNRGVHVPQKTAQQYHQLMEVLKQQYETCMEYSKQYTHLGSVSETTKFEKMAEDCRKNIEILKQAHAQGYPLPKYHYEERTFQVIKIFPHLSNSDMVLHIVKGINLPAPSGIAPNDLDAFVKFEFAFPNSEEAQKDKTNVIKNTNCPEFNEHFKLNINRGHRAFKRVVQTKGIKFEILHKGGIFKNDKVVGTAQLKLEKLESQCEIREILEVLDGRKTTGGRLEVIVKIREPLSSQQLVKVTEKWLVIDPQSLPVIAVPKSKERREPLQVGTGSKSTFPLHSFNIMKFDKERIERKIHTCKQDHKAPPKDLLDQHRELTQRIQWQKSQLDRRDPTVLKEYVTQLERYVHYYTDAAKRLGTEGNRDLAKEALYKRKLVGDELQRFRR
ncbi:coiled-coil and C2 domain-containing protein 1A isoform X2 [Stegostoma tigrinum]|uniref:coiled-coil and C2 domain-containing protein 1A isoform X2 n=1 Tax=Stegostoma tigrinum TaxID=3053191 RepID=UPI00202B5A34|nr:coiled-coil and C2 domain-containing protein 1A isoform X2 [Stegostoma tigrinum]